MKEKKHLELYEHKYFLLQRSPLLGVFLLVLSYLIHKRSAKTQMRGFHFQPINEQLIHKCSIIMTVWLIRIRPHRTHSSRELPSLQNTVNRVKDIKQEGCNIFCQERDYVTEMKHGFLAISGEIAFWRRWVGNWVSSGRRFQLQPLASHQKRTLTGEWNEGRAAI